MRAVRWIREGGWAVLAMFGGIAALIVLGWWAVLALGIPVVAVIR